ncbi:hypothetical protein [Paraburkholderia dilworthii]|uniref:hypothetical protein n=1 Tax=Paraburkholderia dilworthii TaxID=948106 RepID=UPI00042247A6|nr:hypothetical protein [Paraburkholderia dilworthii]
MKLFNVTATATALAVAVVVAVLVGGCSSAWPPPGEPVAQHVPPVTETRTARSHQNAARAEPESRPPVLSVGVSDPDTQLILPWFLADIVDAVNTHQSFGDLLHTMKDGL